MFVAALRVEHFLAIAPAILQLDLEGDGVAPFVSERFELRVFQDFYFVGRFQNRFASNGFFRDLVDEKVAIVQQNGDAEWEIHLSRGHAIGLIGPTDMEFGGASGTNANFVYVFGADLRVIAKNFFERIERRVITPAATNWAIKS